MSNLFTLKDHFKESQLYLNRTVVAAVVVSLLGLSLIIRLVFLQIYQYDLYETLSLNNQVRIVPITPPRGLIFDRNGILLAENVPAFSLELTPERTPDIEYTLEGINTIIPLTEAERRHFYKQLKYKRPNEGIPIRIKLSEEEVAKFSVEKYRFPGVEIVARLIRHYSHDEMFAHVLGYIGPINEQELTEIDPTNYRGSYYIGKNGIEKFHETELHGTVGYQNVETDAKGRTIRVLNRVAPVAGADLYLSLDSRLQQAAYEALKDLKGAIVAISPQTGEVLALVSKPSFDPNLFSQGIDTETYRALLNSPERPLFNRAIRGQYPPGSTIKPVIALQALDVNAITPQFHIFDPGWFQLNGTGRLYRDWIFHVKKRGHGVVDLEKAIVQSCDTYFFTISLKVGIRRLEDIFTRFGLGKNTNIDMTGEAPGLVPSAAWKRRVYNEAWFPGDTLNVGIGQGTLLATPLQMAQVVSTIANRGQRFQPRLVSAIDTKHLGSPVEQNPKEIPEVELQNEENWDIVIDAMQKVIHMPGGTAFRISQGLKYNMAGKTGTAQVFNLKQNEKYEVNKVKIHLRDHSWFIAFAPVEDPKIAIAVLVENYNKTTPGSGIARIVLDSFFNHKPSSKTSSSLEEDDPEDENAVGGQENNEAEDENEVGGRDNRDNSEEDNTD